MSAKRWGNAAPQADKKPSEVDELRALLIEKGVLTSEDLKPKGKIAGPR